MALPDPTCTWETAIEEFVLHMRASRAENTRAFYASQLAALAAWAQSQGIAFAAFCKRDLDKYIVHRASLGLKPTTVAHGAKTAKSFFRYRKAPLFHERAEPGSHH